MTFNREKRLETCYTIIVIQHFFNVNIRGTILAIKHRKILKKKKGAREHRAGRLSCKASIHFIVQDSLDIEPKNDNIAVFDAIVLTFKPHQPLLFGRLVTA
jgi:hypothetical protein